MTTGRYITVSGDQLPTTPDRLVEIDDELIVLLKIGAGDRSKWSPTAETNSDLEKLLGALPMWVQRAIKKENYVDRSAEFQRTVNALQCNMSKQEALHLLHAFPCGPAAKYHNRLDHEFDRSWSKAVEWNDDKSRRGKYGEDCKEKLEVTEDAVAREFTNRFGEKLRFDHDRQSWFIWRNDHWERDGTLEALYRFREIAREHGSRAGTRKRSVAGKASFATGAERLARSDPLHAVRQGNWDRDPLLLGVPGGVVDLRTGCLQPADSQHFITRQTGVAPDVSADCPLWRSFLVDLTGGNDDLTVYLQRLAGYALAGETREHVLAFFYGPGGNGKSVFVNTLMSLLGDYAVCAPMEAFTTARNDRHPTELAMLRGARLVTASETEQGRAWAESRIKQITGGDPITARFMRQDFFTYLPQFKVFIVGNHKPALRSVDAAVRRRFHIVPFVHQPAIPDPRLFNRLHGELPGVLRWAIEGCLDWQRNGLKPPEVVRFETDAYFGTQDLLGQWIEEVCVVDSGNTSVWETIAALFDSWRAFANRANEEPGSMKSFAEALERRGFPGSRKRVCGRVVRVRLGICLQRRSNSYRSLDDT